RSQRGPDRDPGGVDRLLQGAPRQLQGAVPDQVPRSTAKITDRQSVAPRSSRGGAATDAKPVACIVHKSLEICERCRLLNRRASVCLRVFLARIELVASAFA